MTAIEAIIITHARPLLLEKCLASLQSAWNHSRSDFQLKLLIGVNGVDPQSTSCVLDFQSRSDLPINLQQMPVGQSPAAARNQLLQQSFAQQFSQTVADSWLFFIDDDAELPVDFFSRLKETLRRFPSASAIGGPNLTPRNSTRFQRASGMALGSRFGSAASSVRYLPRSSRAFACSDESLILCNLLIRKSAMKLTRFPDHFVCNEENWVLQELRRSGCEMIYDPNLLVWHERRAKASLFLRQVHKYGIGRGQNIRSRPQIITLMHLTPTLSLLISITAVIFWTRFPAVGQVWLSLLLCYLFLWIVATVRMKLKGLETTPVCLLGGILIPMIHLSYGAGILRGLMLRHENP